MPEVELVDVSKSFGRVKAIDHLSLRVEDGEYFTLIGPTGQGKTTILKLIAGLVKPDEGEIYINGKSVTDLPPEDRGVGFVFETFSLFPHYNVWRNTIYGPQVRAEDLEQSNRVSQQLLDMVLLGRRTAAYPRELSGGMMQRLALARALATGSKILLLDEPFGSLDAKIRMSLRNEVQMMVENLGLTAIHVTNDTEEAMTISDRIGVLRRGRIIQVGNPEELYKQPKSIFTASFLGESNFLEGRIKEVTRGGFLAEVEGRKTLSISDPGKWKRGDRVVLVVRAENVAITQGKPRRRNTMQGIVERSQFIQGFMRYEIQAEEGIDLVAWIHTSRGESYLRGSQVFINLEPTNALVFPYPEEGLEQAISFE